MSPKLVYFVFPNLAIGSSILYSNFSIGDKDYESYGIGPVARYYFGKETIYPFISLEYLFIKNEAKGGSLVPYEYERTDFALGFGVDYFLSKNVALEPMVHYIFRDVDYTASSTPTYTDKDEEELSIGIGVNVFIF